MKRNTNLFLAFVLVLAMVITPSFSLESYGVAEPPVGPVNSFDVSKGNEQSLPVGVKYASNVFTITPAAINTTIDVSSNNQETENRIVIEEGVKNFTLVLQGVNIKSRSGSPIELQGDAGVTIELADGTENKVETLWGNKKAGICACVSEMGDGQVRLTASLTIQGNGSLTAIGGNGGAGIGGNASEQNWSGDGGNITIESGTITAIGKYGGAGIGGGVGGQNQAGNGGNIRIIGGQITAKAEGMNGGAGIGGGGNNSGYGGIIRIEGGKILAFGSESGGAGIGGGYGASGGRFYNGEYRNNHEIKITGGEIEASGGSGAAGIGSGVWKDVDVHGGKITISGGIVLAIGGYNAAGIGGGYKASGGTITIESAALVRASSTGEMPAIHAEDGSSGSVINAVIDDKISSSEDSYLALESDKNPTLVPMNYKGFAFSTTQDSKIAVYSDEILKNKMGKIVLSSGDSEDIIITDLANSPTLLTSVRFIEEISEAPPSSSSSRRPSRPSYTADVKTDGGSGPSIPIEVDSSTGQASADVGENQVTEAGTSVYMPAVPNVDTYSIGIPVADISTDEVQGSLTVETDKGSITVPSNMLAGLDDIDGDKALISIGEGDKVSLTDEIKAVIGNRPLIKLALSIDGKEQAWDNPKAPVTLTIPYEPTGEELKNPQAIVVWYIDSSGRVTTIPNGYYDEATGLVTFKTNHFSHYGVAFNEVYFDDIRDDSWYEKAVNFIGAREITKGTGQDKYSPDSRLTRGEFIVLLMNAYGIQTDTNLKDNFSDAGNTWYTDYLAEAKRLGIAAGVGNNKFAPAKEISRQEMFTLVYNALEVIGQLPTGDIGKSLDDFADRKEVASWAQDSLSLLVETGIIEGSKDKINPTRTTNRAEIAQLIYNLLTK